MASLWPTLAVPDVMEAVAFYRDKLSFEVDLTLENENGTTFFAIVELGDSNIMFDVQPNLEIDEDQRRRVRSDVVINLLLPDNMDIDAYYDRVKAQDVEIVGEIGERYWGNREFSISDLNGYRIVFAVPIKDVSFEEIKDIAKSRTKS